MEPSEKAAAVIGAMTHPGIMTRPNEPCQKCGSPAAGFGGPKYFNNDRGWEAIQFECSTCGYKDSYMPRDEHAKNQEQERLKREAEAKKTRPTKSIFGI